ncbi:MAG: AGE family epimerase/isomerase [Bryobacteraceae bacterium]|jgi:mannobiose 2-epimerase
MIPNAEWAAQFRRELTSNILPFWMRHTVDREHGGFHGAIDCDLRVNARAPRAAVINARILWTFSAAARVLGGAAYRETADWAYDYIVDKFWDKEYGGVYWMLDYQGNAISDRKQIYAQAFAAYGMAEYFRATGRVESLEYAQKLYELIEERSGEPEYGGYLEARARDWRPLDDMRLSEKDLNSPKSMNTHLHVLEAYTNLLRVWDDGGLRASLRRLLEVTLERIVDHRNAHFKMFFDNQWNSLTDHVSFGHDIEGGWLMLEAAETLGDRELIGRARELAVRMAQAVYDEGLDKDGSIFYEASQGRLVDPNKHWWAQAEAVVGFYNGYEVSGQEHFRTAAWRAWEYIENNVVDRVHGEWHAKLRPDGTPWKADEDSDACLVGAWKCPYHNGRVCLEMMARL